MTETTEFENVGVAEIAPSGKSIRLQITDPSHTFSRFYYISREQLAQVMHGTRKHTTISYITRRGESP